MRDSSDPSTESPDGLARQAVWESLSAGRAATEELTVMLEAAAKRLRGILAFMEAVERLRGASSAEQERAGRELLAAIGEARAAVSGLSFDEALSKIRLALLPAQRGD